MHSKLIKRYCQQRFTLAEGAKKIKCSPMEEIAREETFQNVVSLESENHDPQEVPSEFYIGAEIGLDPSEKLQNEVKIEYDEDAAESNRKVLILHPKYKGSRSRVSHLVTSSHSVYFTKIRVTKLVKSLHSVSRWVTHKYVCHGYQKLPSLNDIFSFG